MGPALVLLALHYIWVIRADTAFEEAAAEASLLRARAGVGPRRGVGHARASRTVVCRRCSSLAPLGWPGSALLWKNLLAVVRTRRARNMAVAFVVAAVAAAALSFQGDGTVAEIAGWLATTWAALSLVIGPQWVRNDLRSDLLKLDLLRSYPLPGRSVVAAETAASTAGAHRAAARAAARRATSRSSASRSGSAARHPDRRAGRGGRLPAGHQLSRHADPQRDRAPLPRVGAPRQRTGPGASRRWGRTC